jgi:hypothetical protein
VVPASWRKLTLDSERRRSRNSLDAMSAAARIDNRRRSLTTRGLLYVANGLVAALVRDVGVAKHRQIVTLVTDIPSGGRRPWSGPGQVALAPTAQWAFATGRGAAWSARLIGGSPKTARCGAAFPQDRRDRSRGIRWWCRWHYLSMVDSRPEGADAPMDQSREALLAAWPLPSPEGGIASGNGSSGRRPDTPGARPGPGR